MLRREMGTHSNNTGRKQLGDLTQNNLIHNVWRIKQRMWTF